MLIAFHKPCGVLSQFTADDSPNHMLAEFGFPKNVYPIGRLDADSEGLLLLSEEPEWNARLLEPRHAHEREYWVQVERIPTPDALARLAKGVMIQGQRTLPCRAWILAPQPQVLPALVAVFQRNAAELSEKESGFLPKVVTPRIPPRNPPIRFRKSVPDCWIGLELVEGKNRQVRRMTAAIGHPTLRLLRVRIGRLLLGDLPTGHWRILSPEERKLLTGD